MEDDTMKRIWLFLIVLISVFCGVYAEEDGGDFEFKLNFGNFGGGMNFFPDEHSSEVSAELINFFAEHDKTNIGFEITPLKYTARYSLDARRWDQSLYFFNGNIYWNPFAIENIILGPFVLLNYLSVENWSALNTTGYVFRSGLRFFLRTYMADGKYPFQIMGSEIGYKNISGKHGFYFNINLDISILAGIIAGGLSGEASEVIEANEDYERQISGTGPFVPKEPKQPKLPFQNDREID
jgi:hypothetical protein